MLKRVDLAVEDGIDDAMEGRFSGGILRKGLETSGRDYVDYVYNDTNQRLITSSVRQRVENLRASIKAGKVRVPQSLGEACTSQ
jgi:basic membrane lipoprotein Med (substrate-binding protein (PBP1-ABC) superfamily)